MELGDVRQLEKALPSYRLEIEACVVWYLLPASKLLPGSLTKSGASLVKSFAAP